MIISEMDTAKVVNLLYDFYSIENTLKRRGFDVKDIAGSKRVIHDSQDFYEEFKSFSFRQVLRSIYDSDCGLSKDDLLQKFGNLSDSFLDEKLDFMLQTGCVSKQPNTGKHLGCKDRNFGRTFEWFISEIMKREMCGIAASGIKILNLKCGGDFDVIARLEDLLVYIECKSGSIFNISESDLTNFIDRYQELAPSLSICLFDTNGLPDEFKGKFLKADWEKYGLKPREPKKRRIKNRGIFYELYPRIVTLTSEGNLIGNIKLSINHFFNNIKPFGLIGLGQDKLSKLYDEYER